MASQTSQGPGGHRRQHSYVPGSTLAMSDLEYANQRLMDEQSRNGHNEEAANPSRPQTTTSFTHTRNEQQSDLDNAVKNPREPSLISSFFPRIHIRQKTELILVALLGIMLAILVFCIAVFALSAQTRCMSTRTVQLSYGQYKGISLPNGVTQYLGVRYAAPPTRFAAPQAPQNFNGVVFADKYGPGCQGVGNLDDGNAEDCLFADIFTPTNATSTSKLPVYVYIQGGGLDSATGHSNGSGLVLASNKNIVTVSFTYRTGPFGFLASAEVQKNGSLNNGYLDQRQLLQWVQKEIAQFGGDPGHVALGGQSAGAGSVANHLTADGGKNLNLFQGAIMESQSMPPIRSVSDQQFQYDDLVNKTGCSNSGDTLSCLRKLDYATLLSHVDSFPYPDGAGGSPVYAYNPVIDGSFIIDIPMNMFKNGTFVHVPTVFGDVTDEGTIFTPHSLSSEEDSRDFIKNNFPTVTTTQLDKYTDVYDFNDTSGSNYWVKASTAYGETRYICPGIHMSNLITQNNNSQVWNWRYNIATFTQQQSNLNVSHGSELAAVWGPSYSGGPGQRQILQGNGSHIVDAMQGYWTSFIQTFDPNALKPVGVPNWDAWNGTNRILFNINGTTMENITSSQLQRCGYLAQITADLQQ